MGRPSILVRLGVRRIPHGTSQDSLGTSLKIGRLGVRRIPHGTSQEWIKSKNMIKSTGPRPYM